MVCSQRILGLTFITVLSHSFVSAADHPSFVSVELRRQGDRSSSATLPVQVVSPDSAGRWGNYDLRVVIKIPTGSADHAAVHASFDAIVAPRILPAFLQGQDLRKRMSWEHALGFDWFTHSEILPDYNHPLFKATLTTLMLDDAIKRSYSSPGETQWPWIVRANVTIREFDGTILATEHRELEMNPRVSGQ